MRWSLNIATVTSIRSHLIFISLIQHFFFSLLLLAVRILSHPPLLTFFYAAVLAGIPHPDCIPHCQQPALSMSNSLCERIVLKSKDECRASKSRASNASIKINNAHLSGGRDLCSIIMAIHLCAAVVLRCDSSKIRGNGTGKCKFKINVVEFWKYLAFETQRNFDPVLKL